MIVPHVQIAEAIFNISENKNSPNETNIDWFFSPYYQRLQTLSIRKSKQWRSPHLILAKCTEVTQ